MRDDDNAWFAAKKLGYGAGWPIAWQGWLMLLVYIALGMVAALLWETGDEVYSVAGALLFIAATIAFMMIAKTKTQGGWHWRWRKKD